MCFLYIYLIDLNADYSSMCTTGLAAPLCFFFTCRCVIVTAIIVAIIL